ncbi:MAG: 4-hydroxy-tetrahydrodipicolinate synthase, partial [Candidatus Promineifilaceae bacterium]
MKKFKGVYPILPTPFLDDGSLDIKSLRRLIQFQRSAGVHGVAILGHMGEAIHLSEAERRLIIETVMEEAKNDLAVWVGVRAFGTMGCVEQATIAADLGANCVFVAPVNVQNDDVLYQHFKTVADAISIPVMIHDYPTSFSVILSVALISRLGRDGICPYIKLEDYPVGPKVSAVHEQSAGNIGIFGGLGAIYYIEELERGTLGVASGFSFPQVLVQIFNLFENGEVAQA